MKLAANLFVVLLHKTALKVTDVDGEKKSKK